MRYGPLHWDRADIFGAIAYHPGDGHMYAWIKPDGQGGYTIVGPTYDRYTGQSYETVQEAQQIVNAMWTLDQ